MFSRFFPWVRLRTSPWTALIWSPVRSAALSSTSCPGRFGSGGRSPRRTCSSAPADRVWHGIRAELGLDERATSAEVVSLADRRVGNAAAPPRTVRRWLVPLLAAALALVVGVGLGIGLDRISGQRETVIAEAELDALPEWAGATGTATVEQDSDGRRWLVVDVEAPAPNGASQVWLIDNDVVGMSSLGFLTGGHARLPIPDSIDLARFPVVDVSAEPANDADPRHSGDSIVRGKLAL